MRCWEARRKLTAALEAGHDIAADKALTDHLQECADCAAMATSWRSLQADLAAAAQPDLEETVPLTVLRERVEASASGVADHRPKESSTMAALFNNFRKRPRFSIGLAAVAAILVLSALIPFKYDNTIGYEVALAGVDRAIAMDTDRINEFLVQLGFDDAQVSVSDCEKTCKVKISQLASPEECHIVKTAFDEVLTFTLDAEMYELKVNSDGNVFTVHCDDLDDMNDVHFSTDSVHQIIVEKCGADFDGNTMIWMSIDSAESMSIQLDAAHMGFISGDCGDLDADMMQILADSGVHINFEGDDSCKVMVLRIDGDAADNAVTEYTDQDEAAKATDNLPDGFELHQNYPNPFNPTTSISFSLPETQRVTVEVFNIRGQTVNTLVDDVMSAGTHTVDWNATDESGRRVASGMYFYRLTAGDNVVTKKMTLLK